MTKRHSSEANGASELRKRAEEELAKASRSEEADRGKADDIEHELRLHQVELEIQNEELRSAQVELTQVHDRLKNLYDYAPVGYATLTAKGLIHESNHKLADMLNTPRHDLDMSRFSSLILPEDQDIYYHCRRNFLAGRGGSSCELRMLRKGRDPFWANLELALDEQGAKGDPCLRVVISDIDSRKRAEERESVMRKKLEEAERLAAVGVLAAGVAHDLNNLLGPILTLPDLPNITGTYFLDLRLFDSDKKQTASNF